MKDEYVDVGDASELPVGTARVVSAGGYAIAVCHTAKGFFAFDNVCPHRGGPLGEGDLAGDEITCPWHVWSFDVRTGICAGDPDLVLTTHEVRLEEGRVLVRLPAARAVVNRS